MLYRALLLQDEASILYDIIYLYEAPKDILPTRV